ncbi:MAG TPA: hypothetical protein PKM65_20345 [Spirochaetota bacterium]|nr:hypothetical protein [Spirochaetota bacterium]
MSRLIILPKQNQFVEYSGSWSGLSGAVAVELESIVDPGHFKKGYALAKPSGDVLIAGVDFYWGKRLDSTDGGGVDIWDDGVSGPLATGKYIRIVDVSTGKNVTDPTGMNKKIIAVQNVAGNPADDEVFIDPTLGIYKGIGGITYWSKANSLENLTTAANFKKYSPSFSGIYLNGGDGKFGGGCWYEGASAGWSCAFNSGNLSPHGDDSSDLESGMCSYWAHWGWGHNGLVADVVAYLNVYFGHVAINGHYGTLSGGGFDLIINGINAGSVGVGHHVWHHIFAIWDKGKGLSGGKSAKLYINNVLAAQSDADLGSPAKPDVWLYGGMCAWDNYGYTQPFLDNLKIWNVPDESVLATEWNGGAGNETYIGGGLILKAGYYYVAASTDPVTVTEATAPGTKAIITI